MVTVFKSFRGLQMKVFVSWSGELSQKFAELLKSWIEQCIQSADVFFLAMILKREKDEMRV